MNFETSAMRDAPRPAKARGSNQSGMRAYNERVVLSLIRQSGPLAKSEISRMTGLSAQSVSVIMRALEADGLLVKEAPRRGKVGQPLVPMRLAPDGAYCFGLKIGRRSLDLILIDFLGAVVGRRRKTQKWPQPGDVVRFANEAMTELLDELPPDRRARVAGLGVATPFRIWSWAEHLGAPEANMAAWRGRDIAAEIGESWAFPVFLSNDATAACGAELVFGDQTKPPAFLYFFVGFFIGGGLVIDNALYAGSTRNAAALGSMPVSIDGAKARSLVDVASLATLESAVVAGDGPDAMTWETPEDWRIPPAHLDPWMERAASGIAQATLAAASIIDFPCVVLDGWMPASMRAKLTRRVGDRIRGIEIEGIDKPEIREGGVGCDARSLGAASLPLSERYLVDRGVFLKG